MKQVEVTIMGQSYVLACPEGGEDALHAAVGRVDREMTAIRDSGKVKSRERTAVLAALNLAFLLSERGAAQPEIRSAEPSAAPPVDDGAASRVDIEAIIRRIDERLVEPGRTP